MPKNYREYLMLFAGVVVGKIGADASWWHVLGLCLWLTVVHFGILWAEGGTTHDTE